MTIYIYARVSSAAQATGESTSLDFQLAQCSAFARSRYPDIGQVTITEVYSGRLLEKQRKLNIILSLVKGGDIIIFYAVSRLTRDAPAGMSLLASLARKEVRVHSVFEKISYPADRGTFRRLFVDANEESDVISDRVRGAISHIRARNGHVGTPSFGYKTERITRALGQSYCPRKLVANPKEMALVNRIIYYVDTNTELDDIATEAGVGICNVIADTLNAENKLCRGKPWTQFRVRDIYKTFAPPKGEERDEETEFIDETDPCEICKGVDSVDSNPIILCDCCDRGFHMKCMKMASVPDGKFFCSMLCQFKQF